jgi:hypothetical protein
VDASVLEAYKARESCGVECVSEEECKLMNKFNFDSYEYLKSGISKLKFDHNHWIESTCNCKFFLTNNVCVHVVAIAVLNNKIVIPIAYRDIKIDSLSRRGRISLANKAFDVQKPDSS